MTYRSIYILISMVVALSACGTPGALERADGASEQTREVIQAWRAHEDDRIARRSDVLEQVPGAWLTRRSVAVSERDALPALFQSPASLKSGSPLPLSMLTAEIARMHGLDIRIARDVFDTAQPAQSDEHADFGRSRYSDQDESELEPWATTLPLREPVVLIDYAGTLRGLLDTLVDLSGLHWNYREGRVDIARLSTRTFQIKAMPGTSSYSAAVGKKADTKAESRSGPGASDGGDQGMTLNFGAETRISMDSQLNYWEELVAAVTGMLSPAGKVTPSPATNALTVTDIASVVDRVAAYVEAENAVLARQVRLRVQVYSVQLTEESRSGVDWAVAFRAAGSPIGWSASGPVAEHGVSVGRLGFDFGAGRFKGSKLFLQALSKQGKAANVIDTTVVTLNNQPAPVAVTENEGYVAKIEISQGALGAGNVTTATQAMLTTGFVMSLLPTLLDNRSVMLQVQVDMSQKKGLKTFSTDRGVVANDVAPEGGAQQGDLSIAIGTGASGGAKGQAKQGGGGGGATVQLPHTSSVQTMQRASLKTGETLVLSGFRRAIDSADRNGVYRYEGGMKSALLSEEEIIILISPTLMQGV